MRILMLGDPASIHTVKWVNSLAIRGLKVHLFGLGTENPKIRQEVEQHIFPVPQSRGNIFKKLKYFSAVPYLRKVYRQTNPDIVHAHFATSYGLLGIFLKHKPYIVSLWGSDIFDFPRKSFLHRMIIVQVLEAADLILSTSDTMKAEGMKYTSKKISVTPFGVDLNIFHPKTGPREIGKERILQLGVVKALEKKYGIDLLIKAYAKIIRKLPVKSRLSIVGGGSQIEALRRLIDDLDLQNSIVLKGAVPHSEVADYHRSFDLEIFPTLDTESFGVSVVEAMACGTPVIVSDVSGFKEVVANGECGLIFRRDSLRDLEAALIYMVNNVEEREEYIKKGLQRVNSYYDWGKNVDRMISLYEQAMRS